MDIAVLTDNAKEDEVCSYSNQAGCSDRCSFYLANTMNFNKKGYCDVNHDDPDATVDTKLNHRQWTQRRWFNNKEACTDPANNFTVGTYRVRVRIRDRFRVAICVPKV